MIRAITNSLLSALMVATLLWGGCISCSQFFMFPSAKKDCCKAGQCERSKSQNVPSKECKRMPLEPASSGHVHADLPATVLTAIDLVPAELSIPVVDVVLAVEHSPPDLQALNSTFLI